MHSERSHGDDCVIILQSDEWYPRGLELGCPGRLRGADLNCKWPPSVVFIVCLNIGDNQANQSPQLERWDGSTVGLSVLGTVSWVCAPPPTSTISSLLILSCRCDCRVYRSSSTWTQLEKARQKEPLNLVHSIICSAALLSHSWEILNTLYDNQSTADRHKYHNGLKCLVRFAPNTNLSLISWLAESLEAELSAFHQEEVCVFFLKVGAYQLYLVVGVHSCCQALQMEPIGPVTECCAKCPPQHTFSSANHLWIVPPQRLAITPLLTRCLYKIQRNPSESHPVPLC